MGMGENKKGKGSSGAGMVETGGERKRPEPDDAAGELRRCGRDVPRRVDETTRTKITETYYAYPPDGMRDECGRIIAQPLNAKVTETSVTVVTEVVADDEDDGSGA